MWQNQDNKLYKKFKFKDFTEAVKFINQVADAADKMNHHPKIHNSYNTVELWLSTHDAGDSVTEKDHKLAEAIDALNPAPKSKNGAEKVSQYTQVKLYADGGSRGNPGPSASGYVLFDMDDKIIAERGVYLGITTNNQAEYQAVKYGIEEALKHGAREVSIFLDSLLVVNQMKGVFKVRNRDLWPIHDAIKEMMKNFKKVTFTHVPRELNKLADAEVNKVLDIQAKK